MNFFRALEAVVNKINSLRNLGICKKNTTNNAFDRYYLLLIDKYYLLSYCCLKASYAVYIYLRV